MTILHQRQTNQRGSIMIALIIFVIVGMTIASIAVMLVVDVTINLSAQQRGNAALDIAESGAENAILMLLRDPGYTGGTLTVGTGQATMSVTGSDPVMIRSVGTLGAARRSVEVRLSRQQGAWTVEEWYEIF